MTHQETLPQHLQVCNELHELALEENRQLKEHGRVPPPASLERKRALLARLEQSLADLRAGPNPDSGQRPLVEKIRGRILQLLHLDKENEQLLLRASLSRGFEPGAAPEPVPSSAMLRKIYAKTGA